MSATIVYKSAQLKTHSVLSVRGKGREVQLAARGNKKPFFTGEVDGDGLVKPILEILAKGQVATIKWSAGKHERQSFVTFDLLSKIPRIVMTDGSGDIIIGAPSEDGDADNDHGGNVSAMMDPVSAGVIIVGMLIVGVLGWKALDQGGSIEIKGGTDGTASVTITSNGSGNSGELPDNGNDADNRPPLLE